MKSYINRINKRRSLQIAKILFLSVLSLSTVFAQENNENDFTYPLLEGPYMGQKPPGMVAEPFAPGIISKDGWEIEGVFAPGMKEFYFTTRSSKETPITVIGFRQENNVWKKYIEFKRKGEISFSPDGSRMHMAEGYKDRIGEDWSERKSLGPMFDRDDWGIMRLTASSKGTYVFDDYKSDDVIRISRLKDDIRQEPKKMGSVVNTGEWTAHPFIAPDESYLIWDSEREGGLGDSDLYISFRKTDGTWGPAINMGEGVNSDKWDAFASVTSDGKYILFNRGVDENNTDIYWVDAQIIETLRPQNTDFPRLIAHSEPAVTLGKISSLQSKVLDKTIPLSIHLPENYDSSKKTYPVLYMLGSDYRARFAMLASTLDYMGGGQIPEMILIGIDLPEGNRILLPTRDQDTTIPDNYIHFLETELMPHVENTYRTAPFRVLFGGSNSGFFTVYTLLNNPLLFNSYFASSPSLMVIPKVLQQKIKSGPLKTLSKNRFLHIIYSDDEGLTNHVSEFTRALEEHKPASFTYKVDELVNQGHVPAMDFTLFLFTLYPDFNPFNPREDLVSLDTVIQHFDSLSKRYGYEIKPPISVIFNLGFHTILSKNFIAAEEIFQYSLEVYPEGKESYLGMGLLRRAQGELESAKVMIEKALIIDPDFSLAQRWLQRL